MHETIIGNHVARVKPGDMFIHDGDFCFHNSPGGKTGEGELWTALDYQEKLTGELIFIRGNHDRNNSCRTRIESLQVKVGGKMINVVHYPKNVNFDYELNFTAHVHNAWKFKEMIHDDGRTTDCINIGVDVWGFKPVHINEIMPAYYRWKNDVEDEHGKNKSS